MLQALWIEVVTTHCICAAVQLVKLEVWRSYARLSGNAAPVHLQNLSCKSTAAFDPMFYPLNFLL